MNSKNHEHTDRDGHVLGYICNIKIHSDNASSVAFSTAPNTWKMRNAFRKWHAYRDLMFSEAGVTEEEKGRYGKTIRPYLDQSMKGSTRIQDPAGWDLTTQTQEWSYSQIAAAPGFDAAGSEPYAARPVDVYDLHICGENQVEATSAEGTQYFSAVGMIHSYNQDRMEVVTPAFAEVIEGPNNPLALLRQGGSVSGGEVMSVVADQELEAPPYDITDNGISIERVIADIMQINPGYDGTASVPVLKTTQIFVPAGLLLVTTGGTGDLSDALMLIDVVGIVRCKDMA